MNKYFTIILVSIFCIGCSGQSWNNSKTMSILGGGAGGYSAYALGSNQTTQFRDKNDFC